MKLYAGIGHHSNNNYLADIGIIKELLGHSASATTTQIFTQVAEASKSSGTDVLAAEHLQNSG